MSDQLLVLESHFQAPSVYTFTQGERLGYLMNRW